MSTQITSTPPEIPGYKRDAQGRLVPVEMIKPIDLQRDDLVADLVKRAKVLSDALRCFRESGDSDISAFVDLSLERYNVKLGGDKGNVCLTSYDGRYKIERDVTEHMEFDEGLKAAKALVDECLREWSESSGPELRTLVTRAFNVDRKGKINIKRILELRQHDFKHPKWALAMEAISNALKVTVSRRYIRVYERDDKGGYQPINLDVANANYNAAGKEAI